MSRPTVTQARAWRPETLRELAQACDALARRVSGAADAVLALSAGTHDHWDGAAAEAARGRAGGIAADAAAAARRLIAASVAADDGADQVSVARADVLDALARVDRDGLAVADDGAVIRAGTPDPVLVLLAGGDAGAAGQMLDVAAAQAHSRIIAALDRLGAADGDAASDLAAALTGDTPRSPAATVPAGAAPGLSPDVAGWPTTSQDGIAAQIAAMTPDQRDRLVEQYPRQVGNTDGVPWPMRVAANRINIAAALLAESGRDTGSRRRIALYRDLLGEIDDPARSGARIRRQILAFDPARASLVELNGDLATARSVAVLVPGVNTTIEGSAATTATARRFVSGSRGDAAVITYLGGPFPQVHDPAAALLEAADPRDALAMAPRLVAFSEDVDRTVAPGVPVTVIGHSYGGSIVGTAEALGLTSDRTLLVAAAGSGVGVDDPSDWHNRNPDVLRFSMTAPGDFIEAVQGIPGGPHGADPDEMPGVIRLAAGDYDDGQPVAGWEAHSGMLNRPSDSWRTVLAVITGDSETLHRAVADAPQ
ncbi:alpha/beta hydrolase family protein [Mycolicibacterium rufum]|uniref:Alpha/beta hydrolase family protein n=1 Tax=Mycolicibacterium rufum TaxID=318424 RepID=A0ABY3UCJ4_9MYCO|nr:alpha/beta hydrolase [Mycolicibacterium rufum]KGI68640.1 alpha/beta hydrolase [Mycolicibacterium rufum]ULP34783.1 alpha/beta hydrolase family protein [Mycolicibacterium rufum]